MKAFIFALSLEMKWPTMTNSNDQLHQPDPKDSVPMLTVRAPRSPVVHQHPAREVNSIERWP